MEGESKECGRQNTYEQDHTVVTICSPEGWKKAEMMTLGGSFVYDLSEDRRTKLAGGLS